MTRRISVRATAVLLAVPLALSACGGGDSGDNATQAAPTTAATSSAPAASGPFETAPGAEVDKTTFIQETTKATSDKGTYAIEADMSAAGQPMTMTGSVDAKDQANPKMTLKMTLGGQAMDFLIVDKMAYMQLPGVTGGKYIKMSLEEMYAAGGGTGDFEKMLNPQGQLEAQQAAIEKVTYVGEEAVDGETLYHYTVLMDPAKAMEAAGQTALPSAAATAMPEQLAYEFYLDSEKLTRRAKIDDPSMSVDMRMKDYGKPVTITAPPTSQVTTMPGLPGAGTATP